MDHKKLEKTKISNNFFEFLSNSKISIMIIIFFIILAFGQRLLSNSFSIDTEIYINNFKHIYDAFLRLGRPSLVLINNLLNISHLIPFINVFLTLVLMASYSILFNYLFFINIGDKYKHIFLKLQFIFPIMFLTNPIFAEQYNFIFQSVGVAIGISIIPIVLIIINNAITSSPIYKRILYYIFSICAIAFSFGIYQSLIPLHILTVVSVYLTKICLNDNEHIHKDKNQFKYLLINIAIFFGGLILYIILTKLTKAGNEYLQYCWTKPDIGVCTRNIYYVILEAIKCQDVFYNTSYLIALGFLGIIIIYKLITKTINIGFIVGTIGLILSPFYIMIATGVDQLYRTQFNYPFFIAFIFLIFILLISEKKNLLGNMFLYLVCALSIFISYKQSIISAKLFYSDEIRYNSDIAFGHKIQSLIESKSWYEKDTEYTLIFVGSYEEKPSTFLLKGEVMGYSFFEFDYPYIYGTNQRANMFLKTLRYRYNFPSNKQFLEAKKFVVDNNIPTWPSADSVIKTDDNTIIVRLSIKTD